MVYASPSRKSLIHLLAGEDEGALEEQVLKDVENFNINLLSNLEIINSIYRENNLDSIAKV